MAASAWKVLIVDDHEVVRMGLTTLLATDRRFAVVGQADNVASAVMFAAALEPDVVIMDVRLPDGSGIEACREIRSARPETRVLMLTSYDDRDAVIGAILAGAAGYLLKRSQSGQLLEALVRVARGESLLDPAVTAAALEWMRRASPPRDEDPLAVLSGQERRVLVLVAEGKTNREIARTLLLSELTVKTYVSQILRKLHLARRAEAAAFLARQRQGPRL
jgi:two-component system response regulator DevR